LPMPRMRNVKTEKEAEPEESETMPETTREIIDNIIAQNLMTFGNKKADDITFLKGWKCPCGNGKSSSNKACSAAALRKEIADHLEREDKEGVHKGILEKAGPRRAAYLKDPKNALQHVLSGKLMRAVFAKVRAALLPAARDPNGRVLTLSDALVSVCADGSARGHPHRQYRHDVRVQVDGAPQEGGFADRVCQPDKVQDRSTEKKRCESTVERHFTGKYAVQLARRAQGRRRGGSDAPPTVAPGPSLRGPAPIRCRIFS
jgi:hypothetical protein